MHPFFHKLSLPLLVAVLAGCQSEADDFFSGRPSGMSMAHNQVLANQPDAMLKLVSIPSRFPDAESAHILDWQASVVAWWLQPAQQNTLRHSVAQLNPAQRQAFDLWLTWRPAVSRSPQAVQTLDRMAQQLSAQPELAK